MFRVTMCPSSGEITVTYTTLGICYSVWMTGMPDSHPYRVTNTKFRIDTVISPDDGHTFARNT